MVISQKTEKLIEKYEDWWQSLQKKEELPTLHVDEVASKVAAFYEKIRGVIDWREEHLIRKTAIERILKRRLLLMENGKEIALPFLLELIRGGHFPNDTILESKVGEIQKIIDKYIFIFKNSPEKERIELYNWLLSIAACEIEESLSPPKREKALIDYMNELLKERIELKDYNPPTTLPAEGGAPGTLVIGGLKKEEKNKQIFIAIERALFKFDDPLITFHLLERKFPNWQDLSQSQLEEVAKNIYAIKKEIEKNLKHPLAEKFYQIAERYDTAYLILGDIISQDPTNSKEKISHPEILENLIKEAYQRRLLKSRQRVQRAAFYSTISIFLTKMLLAFTVEAGFNKLVTGTIDKFTLGLNIAIPPLLMGFLILTIRPPAKENLQRVTMEIMKIAYQTEKKESYLIKSPQKRGFLMEAFLLIFYLLSFFISFGIIIKVLQKLNFGILSIIIFLVYLSLILFAATRIRQRAKELEIGEGKESILTFLFDFLTLPIVRVGKWLSSQWERYNILVVLFNLLIELPFQFFTEFLEQLRYFWKEKKDEIH